MTMKNLTVAVAISALVLTSCAGRTPQPIAVASPADNVLACDALQAEMETNATRLTELEKEASKRVGWNTGAVIGSLFFLPALFMLDLKGAAREEADAIKARNMHLASMRAARRCPTSYPGSGYGAD
jgi:hypothetical protein